MSKHNSLILTVCFIYIPLSWGCIHDSINHRVLQKDQEYPQEHPFIVAKELRRRRLSTSDLKEWATVDPTAAQTDTLYKPIRITPFFDNDTMATLSPEDRTTVYKIVQDAIRRFSETLRVVRVQGNLMAHRSCARQWQTNPPTCKTVVPNEMCLEMPIPPSHFGPTRVCATCYGEGCAQGACSTIEGAGIPDTDFTLYIRAAQTSYCGPSVLAYASACQKEQFDRPTFGMINMCPTKIDADPDAYEAQLSTAMHEITHALGFSSQFFAYMRGADGAPRTRRSSAGEPPAIINGKCANGATVDYFPNPSGNTVAYSSERDHTVAKMVTPRVAEFVKNHFNCSSVTGAELESQDDDGCMGSHWEERLFESEYMSPASSFRNVFSGLTLAFFEDSGWYRANLAMAKKLSFGARKGCGFATEKCISPKQTSIAEDHYCTSNTQESCSVDGLSRSVCSITNGETIPSEYQYFTDPSKGSLNHFADFCPINTGYKFGDCRLPGNLISPLNTNLNILGETYCPNCRCTKTTLRSTDSRAWTVNARRQTGCYALSCGTNGTVTLTIPRIATSDTVDVVCNRANEVKSVAGFSGTITCPDPAVVCERECPRSCAGNGMCDSATAKCTCFDGWYGEDCTSKSASYIEHSNIRTSTKTQPNSSQTPRYSRWLMLLSIAFLSIS
uniref:Leishmanolysinlike peptidase putative n=1 Tax=Albugo laibachii Nc14 TaxID=890382 RepID=F0WCZ5_9STRA|nr:leishmanolysinlike peptidase putative [Albugo laibachii Nc14]|eukprot:CCA19066.1 leishmanolysinlike peptidase putative [Albugo laibachii Nc14]